MILRLNKKRGKNFETKKDLKKAQKKQRRFEKMIMRQKKTILRQKRWEKDKKK